MLYLPCRVLSFNYFTYYTRKVTEEGYFRLSAVRPTTREEVKQLDEVIAFRNKFRSKGLFREYETPAAFCNQLREHLTLWLNQRQRKSPKSLPGGIKPSQTTLKSKTKFPIASDRKKPAATIKTTTAKTTTTDQPSTTSRKAPNSKSSTIRSNRVVKSPGNWVMLDGKFFQAKSSNTQPDRSIILQVVPKDTEQIAELKALHPGEFHYQKEIIFADSYEARIMQVSFVTNESTAGRTSFSITLNPNQQSQNSGFGEVNYPNYNAGQIAELRACLILLGQVLPEDIRRFVSTQITVPHNHTKTIENGIFPELWAKLQTQPELFLPKAWLWAAYCLKMSQIVENILELELGPIKNKKMPVRFRGKRKQFYSDREPSIIRNV